MTGVNQSNVKKYVSFEHLLRLLFLFFLETPANLLFLKRTANYHPGVSIPFAFKMHNRLFFSQVSLTYPLIGKEVTGFTSKDTLACFQNITPVSNLKRHPGILFHQ